MSFWRAELLKVISRLKELQPLDATLTAIASLTGAANKGIYFTDTDEAALFDLTAAGRAILDDANASAQRTTLGLGTAATQNTGTSGANLPFANGANTWASIQTFSANPLVAGGAVSFPATQVPSAGANDLDDYEEGTFTPTILGTTAAGVGTYSVQTGTYIKVGKEVFVDLTVVWSAHTGTGNILVGGLPFTSAASTPCSINGNNLTFANQLTASFVAGAAQARPLTHVTGGALALVAMDTAAEIRLSGIMYV